jgi:PTH1 family peptidyl-tRNA hydrolase
MKLVVGLGNPGSQYDNTRHNVGFRVVDKLATQLRWNWNERRSRAVLASGMIGAEKVILVKPLTYMNLSGEAVAELLRWYKLQPYDIFVVCDDLDLPVGKIRLRTKGSAGGQKGLDNIIYHLHTNEFPRLRIGIGRPTNTRKDPISYVLGVPSKDERIELDLAEDRAARKAEERRQQQQARREQERLQREQQQAQQELAAREQRDSISAGEEERE